MEDDVIIREYRKEDLDEISNIIVRNMLEVNSKDYGLKEMEEYIKPFTKERIADTFSNRTKIWVAIKNNKIVGTAGLEADWSKIKDTYWVLSVFTMPEYHNQGIGRKLMNKLEDYAHDIKAKKIIIPASITGNGFYYKLGYKYINNEKVLNSNGHYMMEKDL